MWSFHVYMYLDMDILININTKCMHLHGYNIWVTHGKYDGQNKAFFKFWTSH
jgi:hypothetical protein